MSSASKKNVLFVCLGNTCRSPIAEAVFIDEVKRAAAKDKWEVDSAALAPWHVGNGPNARSLAIMSKYNLAYDNKARQIKTADFHKFDYIFGMDYDNMYELHHLAPRDGKANLLLLCNFDPEGVKEIYDPYCDTNSDGFEECYAIAVRCCKEFLRQFNAGKI